MNPNPLISVIIPVYNVEKFLAQCLESVAHQTYRNLEIICLNDGSKDGSLDIMRSFAQSDERFVVVDKQNQGYGATCNRGLDFAQGEYIAIVEPDDYFLPDMFEEMIAFARSLESAVDVIKTPWLNVMQWDTPEKEYVEPSPLYKRKAPANQPFSVAEFPVLLEQHPAIWSALYRKAFLNEKGIRFREYPGAGWADNPFLIETLCQTQSIAYLDKPFYCYRADLPGSTKNHATDALIALPFERWLDMTEIMRELDVKDSRIWAAHYRRGFNYISGAIYDDGWDSPIVKAKTAEVLEQMDAGIVLSYPKNKPSEIKLYLELTGQPPTKVSPWPYRKHLLQEIAYYLRAQGISGVIKKIVERSKR